MIPGMGNQLKGVEVDESQLVHVEAMITSMTDKERANPDIINPSRKRRIASGSGMEVEDVNRLLAQFRQMQKVMKQMAGSNGIRKGIKGGKRHGMPGKFRR